ncbi:MAG: PASTA domain-containing protein, partial [Rikenellaceae bacterium]
SGISLVVGLNPSAPEVIIPSIVGLNAGEAKNRLWEAGFNVVDVVSDVDVTSENYENAKVYKQEPLAARKAMHGRTISFNISADNNKVNNAIDNTSKEILKYQQELLKEDSTTIDSEAMEFERIMREMDSEID